MSWMNGIIISLSKLEWGTVADWVSGIGSLIAIAFAYLQISEQRKEYEEDKKEKIRREILANRPFFSLSKSSYLTKTEDHLWLTIDDNDSKIVSNILKNTTNNNDDAIEFKDGIWVYKFKNVSKAIATKVVLKIEYQNRTKDKVLKTDYCYIKSCVMENEQVIILPHSIMNEPSTYSLCPKSVNLYFSTIDDKVYCQRWIEKFDKSDDLGVEQFDIKEVPIEEIPSEGTSSICAHLNLI